MNKTKFQLIDALYPLDGFVEMKVRCYAEDAGNVGNKGFLVRPLVCDEFRSITMEETHLTFIRVFEKHVMLFTNFIS